MAYGGGCQEQRRNKSSIQRSPLTHCPKENGGPKSENQAVAEPKTQPRWIEQMNSRGSIGNGSGKEKLWSVHTYSQTPNYTASSCTSGIVLLGLLETGKRGIKMSWKSPEMFHSGGHIADCSKRSRIFVRWTKRRAEHHIKGNIKYKLPERLDIACLGKQKMF